MNDNQLSDFRQFIDSRISQSEQAIKSELGSKLDKLNQKIDDGFTGIGDAIAQIHDQIDETSVTTDQRLIKLEQKAV